MRDLGRVIAAWWRRQSPRRRKRVLLPRAGAVALVFVIASIVVAKLAWGTSGPSIVTPFAFAGLFFAAVILLALALASCDELVDELEASHPPRVRTRGVVPRVLRQWIAAASRAVLVWLVWLGTAMRHELRRKSGSQWLRYAVDALAGIPPPGASVAHAGPLARPGPPRPPQRRPRRRPDANEHGRDRHRPPAARSRSESRSRSRSARSARATRSRRRTTPVA